MSSALISDRAQSSPTATNGGSSSRVVRRVLDVGEKLILLVCYSIFLVPVVQAVASHGDLGACLLAVSETLVVALVLFRKPAQVLSQRPLDWFLAFGATLAPTLVRPIHGSSSPLANLAVLLMVVGICLQIGSKAMLGRRFGLVAANRGICASGPYRIVRHPIYMGYLLTHIGFLCISPSSWNVMVYALAYSLMIPRIFAEERLLGLDPLYIAYTSRVRWRLIPGVL